MAEFEPKIIIVEGESGQEYESIHEDGPINLGGGTDTLQAPTTQD